MRQADVLTMHGAPGLHYEPPLVRCFEPNDHVHQNANGIVGKPNTDVWNPCQKPFKVANQSHMHIVPNTMYPQNQGERCVFLRFFRFCSFCCYPAHHASWVRLGGACLFVQRCCHAAYCCHCNLRHKRSEPANQDAPVVL